MFALYDTIPFTFTSLPASRGCQSQARRSSCMSNPAVHSSRVQVRPPRPEPPQMLDGNWKISRQANESGLILFIQLPGFSKADISMEVSEASHELSVHANTTPSIYYPTGAQFAKAFRLGTNVDTNAVSAAFHEGILTVRLPAKASTQPKGPRKIVIEGPEASSPCSEHQAVPVTAAAAPVETSEQEVTTDSLVHKEEKEAGTEDMPELESNPATTTTTGGAADADDAVVAPAMTGSEKVDAEEEGSVEDADYYEESTEKNN